MKTKRILILTWLLCGVLTQALISSAQPVISVSAGSVHTLFLKADGSLWAMGDNIYGQLGDGTTDNENYYTNLPERIVASDVMAIAAGGFYSMFLKSDGSLWGMGYNQFGQLGDGTYGGPLSSTNLPEQLVASNVTAIAAASANTSLFLKSDGSLWVMGQNNYGQLGDGTYNDTNRPEMIVASNVVAIAAGAYHSLFLKSDGSLWVMGGNFYGQLGDGTYTIPTFLSRLSPVTSPQSPRGTTIACSSRAMAACGRWAGIILASWATTLPRWTTALIIVPTFLSRSWPATSR
jgi:alpha-tubulin suppressor-like RCC1 family protein